MSRSRVLRFLLLAAALCASGLLAAGCGSSSTLLATADAARLQRDVASIRSAASVHNPAAAHAAVRALEADVSQLRAAGRLAPADASVLLSDADQVDRRVSLEVRSPASPAPTSSPAQTTSPAQTGPTVPAGSPPPPGAGHGPHGKGKGKGHGDGNGQGGGGGDGGD
jgi:hypothetical protein